MCLVWPRDGRQARGPQSVLGKGHDWTRRRLQEDVCDRGRRQLRRHPAKAAGAVDEAWHRGGEALRPKVPSALSSEVWYDALRPAAKYSQHSSAKPNGPCRSKDRGTGKLEALHPPISEV
jgi:hypothetical protein